MKYSKIIVSTVFSILSTLSYAQEHVIRFAHVQTPTSIKGMGGEKFKELVEKYSDNKIKVEIYHDSKLYNDRDSATAIIDNKVEMLAPTISQMELFYKNEDLNPWVVMDFPFLFNKLGDIEKLKQKGVFESFNKKPGLNNVVLLDIWNNGFRGFSTNKKITDLSDFNDLKPRIPFSQVLKAQFLSWGSYPRVTDYSGLALLTKYDIVDSADNPPANFYTSKMYQFQRYFYLTNHSYTGYSVLFRKNFFESLPPNLQDVIKKALNDTTKYVNDLALRDTTYALENISLSGLTRIIDMPQPVLDQMRSKSSEIEAVLSTTQKQAYYDIKKALE